MNILLTSAGRRSYLVKYFKNAIGKNSKVIVCNSIDDTPAMQEADIAYRVPFVYEEGYIETVVNICKKHEIKFIFSLHDLDGPILSRNRAKLEKFGAHLMMSKSIFIENTLDKYKTYKFLKENNILTPKTWLTPEAFFNDSLNFDYPVIIKPRWGFGSIDLLKAYTYREVKDLYRYFENHKNYKILKYLGYKTTESATIIQEYIKGYEYGLGIINDYRGNFINSLLLKKKGMRSGETDAAVIVRNEEIEELGNKMGRLTEHIGILDCDIIKYQNLLYVLEINPRFGGQYPFFHMAGANVPEFLIGVNKNLKLPIINKSFYKDIKIVAFNK